jgi:GAF domain-containing protein
VARPAELDRLLRTLAEGTGELLDADAALALPEPVGRLVLRAGTGALAKAQGESLPVHGSFCGAVLSGAGVRATSALAREPYAHATERALAAGRALGVPLAGPHGAVGLLLAVRPAGAAPFGDAELAAAAQLAPFAAAALAGARAYAEQRTPAPRGGLPAAALVRAVRHELNNPLSVVAGTVHLMEASVAAGDLRGLSRSLRLMRDASDRLRDLSARIGRLERAPECGFVTEHGGLGVAAG